MEKSKVLETVKKLLSMTIENGATENEAQIALVKARKLMLKYKLSKNDLNDENNNVVSILLKEYNFEDSWISALASVFYNNFPVFHYYVNIDNKLILALFGNKTDVECVSTLLKHSHDFVINASNKYYDDFKALFGESDNVKTSYIYGFINGLADKYEEQNLSKEFSIMLTPSKEVKDKFNEFSKEFNKKEVDFNNDLNDIFAANAGYKEGKKFGTTGLNFGKRMISEGAKNEV